MKQIKLSPFIVLLVTVVAIALPVHAEEETPVQTQAIRVAPAVEDGAAPDPLPMSELFMQFRTIEQEILADIQAEGRQQVKLLSQRLPGLTNGPERHALQLQIIEVKKASRVRFLERIIKFADAQNDEIKLAQAKLMLKNLTEPSNRALPRVDRERSRPVTGAEGGQR